MIVLQAGAETRRSRPGSGITPPRLVGCRVHLGELRARIEAVANRNSTVLICGESGVGKEMVARHIHASSQRASGPFVTVDCTTLRDALLESQLFGHVKGAFTGAEHSTVGLFRSADGGTLFLDEVGELSPQTQAKLLRCIQESAVVPLGAVHPIPVNVRIIAATNRDLKEMALRGEFREDLRFRLDVVRLRVSPLRERRDCVRVLAEHFARELSESYQEPLKALAPETVTALRSYSWPGNVRELRNAIEHAFVFSAGDLLGVADLPEPIRPAAPDRGLEGQRGNGNRRNGAGAERARRVVPLAVVERCLIKRALRATDGNQTQAAELLGVERHRLARMIRRHGLRDAVRPARG